MAGRVHALGSQPVIIGREDADIIIDAPDLSRRHLRIAPVAEGWSIEDLESRNGTFVNGEPLRGQRALVFGDRLQLGATTQFLFAPYDAVAEKLLELQKMEAVGQLAAGVAHDFRNLLSAIQNNLTYLAVELQRESFDRHEFSICVEETQQAARQATELTQRLLGVARRGERREERVDLLDLVEEVVALCRRSFPPTVEITTTAGEHEELILAGDQGELHQVLMNLCVNARDAMPDGGLLEIELRQQLGPGLRATLLATGKSHKWVQLEVRDQGVGMDAQTRARIFEPFFSTKGERGTGLGLATVFNVVHQHGGDIEVDSAVGLGTTFRILLPLLDQPTTPAETIARVASAEVMLTRGKSVLLVDDEPKVLAATSRLLRGWGYPVLATEDGREAVMLFEKHREEIGCAVIDVVMPNLDGKALLRILRLLDASLPVVLTSGRLAAAELRSLLGPHDAFVAKPHDEELRQALEACLGLAKATVS